MRQSFIVIPGLACVLTCGLACGIASADNVSQIDLTGVQIRNATPQSRTSNPDTLDPGCTYTYSISGMVRGRGGLLAVLYPNPTPLAQVLETLSAGSSAGLNGTVSSPNGGTHPVTLTNAVLSGSTTILGVPTTVSATLVLGVDASNYFTYNLTDVVVSPAGTLGYFEFTSGTALVISQGGCPSDFNSDCFVDFFDYDDYVACFESGACPPGKSADFNGDGFADFFDYDDFVTAFESGC